MDLSSLYDGLRGLNSLQGPERLSLALQLATSLASGELLLRLKEAYRAFEEAILDAPVDWAFGIFQLRCALEWESHRAHSIELDSMLEQLDTACAPYASGLLLIEDETIDGYGEDLDPDTWWGIHLQGREHTNTVNDLLFEIAKTERSNETLVQFEELHITFPKSVNEEKAHRCVDLAVDILHSLRLDHPVDWDKYATQDKMHSEGCLWSRTGTALHSRVAALALSLATLPEEKLEEVEVQEPHYNFITIEEAINL